LVRNRKINIKDLLIPARLLQVFEVSVLDLTSESDLIGFLIQNYT